MISRAALLTRVRPLVEDLAVELVTIIHGRLEGQIDETLAQALDAARSALASDLDAPVQPHRDRANMLRRTANATAKAKQPLARRPATCRRCGAVGFTSKGCGTTHNTIPFKISALSAEPATSSGKITPADRIPSPAPPPLPVDESEVPELELVDAGDDDQEDEIEDGPPPAPASGRRDRFAEIEAARAARKVTDITSRTA